MSNKIDLVKCFELALELDEITLSIQCKGNPNRFNLHTNDGIELRLVDDGNGGDLYSGNLHQEISKDVINRLIYLFFKKYEEPTIKLLLSKFGESIIIKENE